MKTSKKEEGHLLGREKITEGQAGDLHGDLHAKGFSDPGKGCPLAPRPPAAPELPPSWPSADLVPQLPVSWEDGLKWIALCLWPARLTLAAQRDAASKCSQHASFSLARCPRKARRATLPR